MTCSHVTQTLLDLLSPMGNGCKAEDQGLRPLMMPLSPAPVALLVFPKCCSSMCSTLRYKCGIYSLQYEEVCACDIAVCTNRVNLPVTSSSDSDAK